MALSNAEITERLNGITSALAADGYHLAVEGPAGGRITARIVAGPDACADCLVPKGVMGGLLAHAIGDAEIGQDAIDLVYPVEAAP